MTTGDKLLMLSYLRKEDVIASSSTINHDFLDWREKVLWHHILGEENEDGFITGLMFIEVVDNYKKALRDGYIAQIGVSFGKDSGVLLLAFYIACVELKLEGFKPEHNSIIVHSDTRVDNPEISNLAKKHWNQLVMQVVSLDLPIDFVLAQPSFSQSFVGRVVTGRGLPTTTSSNVRQCSMDLKVNPSTQAVNQYLRKNGIKLKENKVALFLGSRDDESVIRSKSIASKGGTSNPFSLTFDESTLRYNAYFIKHFTTSMIWEILTFSGEDKLIPSFINNYDDVITVYADSSSECIMFATSKTEAANSASCGSRHGCWTCLVSGGRDKSMESLIENDEKYAYLKPLNRIRNYISLTHYDWEARVITNRGIDKFGYTKIQPDLYGFAKVRRILHGMITADHLEEERAYQVATDIVEGRIPDTAENWEMATPRFQTITAEDCLRIEYLWSFHSFSDKPFQAIEIWKDVYEHGIYELFEDVDDMEEVKRTPQPAPYYLHVGSDWTDKGLNQGLIDHEYEAVAFDSEGLRVAYGTSANETFFAMPVGQSSSLAVSEEAAEMLKLTPKDFLSRSYEGYHPTRAAIQLLRSGAISIAKGKIGVYQKMAQRQQFYSARKLNGQISLTEALARSDLNLLSREQYLQEISKHGAVDYEDITIEPLDVDELLSLFDVSPEEDQLSLLDCFGLELEEYDDSTESSFVPTLTSKSKIKVEINQLGLF